jgi:DNA-binding MarR family transcriptional regulator
MTAPAQPEPHREPTAAGGGPVSHAIFRVARLHKMFAGQLLRETGLYPGQELLMMLLWDGGPQRQVDLIRSLDSDAATMTRTVRRLERAGFVRRSSNPADRRVVIIEATPASLSLRVRVEDVWRRLETTTVGTMNPSEREDALQVLNAIEANLLSVESEQRIGPGYESQDGRDAASQEPQ